MHVGHALAPNRSKVMDTCGIILVSRRYQIDITITFVFTDCLCTTMKHKRAIKANSTQPALSSDKIVPYSL